MCKVIFKGVDSVNPNPVKDKGCYKRGMPVEVVADDYILRNGEQPPAFYVLSIPLISKSKALKYMQTWVDNTDPDKPVMVKKRLWMIRGDDLPASAKNKLLDTGQLVIKATALYKGDYDYTWTQVKTYFRNQLTDTDETESL